MELTPERLLAQLPAEPLRPLYLIAGSEPLRVLETADAVRAHARANGFAEREVFDADGRSFDWGTLEATFHTPSLFSARRLIELRLPSGKPGKDGAQLLTDYAANPPADIALLITCEDWSRQHGGKWSQGVAKVGHLVIAQPVRPHEMPGWIETRLHQRGVHADRQAVLHLAERVEGNLLAAAQEIDKLALLADGAHLDVARMEALVADSARYDVFRLMDAALNGQPAQVSRMLAGLRAEGEAVFALMGMVVMELHRVAALARVAERGGNLAVEFKAQRVWDAKQAVYRRALQRHPAPRWQRLAVETSRVDRVGKGRWRVGEESADAWQILERLLLAVAEPKAGALVTR